jgi:hypothetical protein
MCRLRIEIAYVFVNKSRIGALPCCDATAAVAECHETRLNPSRAEAIKEVGLASDLVLVEVGVSKLANVYLIPIRFCNKIRRVHPPYLGTSRTRRNRIQY